MTSSNTSVTQSPSIKGTTRASSSLLLKNSSNMFVTLSTTPRSFALPKIRPYLQCSMKHKAGKELSVGRHFPGVIYHRCRLPVELSRNLRLLHNALLQEYPCYEIGGNKAKRLTRHSSVHQKLREDTAKQLLTRGLNGNVQFMRNSVAARDVVVYIFHSLPTRQDCDYIFLTSL